MEKIDLIPGHVFQGFKFLDVGNVHNISLALKNIISRQRKDKMLNERY